jgi:hypothetical protein
MASVMTAPAEQMSLGQAQAMVTLLRGVVKAADYYRKAQKVYDLDPSEKRKRYRDRAAQAFDEVLAKLKAPL